MGLNFVAEYLKMPLEFAVDLRKRQDRSNQAQEKLSQGYQKGDSDQPCTGIKTEPDLIQ